MRRPARLAAVLAAATCLAAVPAAAQSLVHQSFIRGANYASMGGDHFAGADSDRSLERLHADHVGMIAIAAGQQMDPATDHLTALRLIPTPGGPAGPNAAMAHAVEAARKLGMRVAIKLSVIDKDGKTPQAFNYAPHDWDRFWSDYRDLVLTYARFAAENRVELLFIGTELGARITGPAHREDWMRLIADVRKLFPGKLSYAATAEDLRPDCYAKFDACWWGPDNDEAHWLSFWGALDYAGINVYPHFTATDPATLAREMAAQAAHWRAEIAATGRPGLIAETGAPSMKGAERNTSGWQAPPDTPADWELQAALYNEMIGYWLAHGPESNVAGVFVWVANTYDYTNGKHDPNGFPFTDKPAERVLQRLYGGR